MKLHAGCGFDLKEGYINADIDSRVSPDMIVDFSKHLPWADDTFDVIYTSHMLEHMLNFEDTILEFWRILKVGGTLEVVVPKAGCTIAVAGIGHVRQFVEQTFMLFSDPSWFQPKNHVSDYVGKFKIDILANKVFKTDTVVDKENGDGSYISDIECKMTKVLPQHWKDQNITKDLKTDVTGCFFCQCKLVERPDKTKLCPECGEVYNFKIPNEVEAINGSH